MKLEALMVIALLLGGAHAALISTAVVAGVVVTVGGAALVTIGTFVVAMVEAGEHIFASYGQSIANAIKDFMAQIQTQNCYTAVDSYQLDYYEYSEDPKTKIGTYFDYSGKEFKNAKDLVKLSWQKMKSAKDISRVACVDSVDRAVWESKILDIGSNMGQGIIQAASAAETMQKQVNTTLKKLDHMGADRSEYSGTAFETYVRIKNEMESQDSVFYELNTTLKNIAELRLGVKVVDQYESLMSSAVLSKSPGLYYNSYNALVSQRGNSLVIRLAEKEVELLEAVDYMKSHYKNKKDEADWNIQKAENALNNATSQNAILVTRKSEELIRGAVEDSKRTPKQKVITVELGITAAKKNVRGINNGLDMNDEDYLALATREMEGAMFAAVEARDSAEEIVRDLKRLRGEGQEKCHEIELVIDNPYAGFVNSEIDRLCSQGDTAKTDGKAITHYAAAIEKSLVYTKPQKTLEALQELESTVAKAKKDMSVTKEEIITKELRARYKKPPENAENANFEYLDIYEKAVATTEAIYTRAEKEYAFLEGYREKASVISEARADYSYLQYEHNFDPLLNVKSGLGTLKEMADFYKKIIDSSKGSELVKSKMEQYVIEAECGEYVEVFADVKVQNQHAFAIEGEIETAFETLFGKQSVFIYGLEAGEVYEETLTGTAKVLECSTTSSSENSWVKKVSSSVEIGVARVGFPVVATIAISPQGAAEYCDTGTCVELYDFKGETEVQLFFSEPESVEEEELIEDDKEKKAEEEQLEKEKQEEQEKELKNSVEESEKRLKEVQDEAEAMGVSTTEVKSILREAGQLLKKGDYTGADAKISEAARKIDGIEDEVAKKNADFEKRKKALSVERLKVLEEKLKKACSTQTELTEIVVVAVDESDCEKMIAESEALRKAKPETMEELEEVENGIRESEVGMARTIEELAARAWSEYNDVKSIMGTEEDYEYSDYLAKAAEAYNAAEYNKALVYSKYARSKQGLQVEKSDISGLLAMKELPVAALFVVGGFVAWKMRKPKTKVPKMRKVIRRLQSE